MVVDNEGGHVLCKAQCVSPCLAFLIRGYMRQVQGRARNEYRVRSPLDNLRYGAVVEKLKIGGMNKDISPVGDPGHHDGPQTIARCAMGLGFRECHHSRIGPLYNREGAAEGT